MLLRKARNCKFMRVTLDETSDFSKMAVLFLLLFLSIEFFEDLKLHKHDSPKKLIVILWTLQIVKF